MWCFISFVNSGNDRTGNSPATRPKVGQFKFAAGAADKGGATMKKFFVQISSIYEVEAENKDDAVEFMYTKFWPLPIHSELGSCVEAANPLVKEKEDA